MAGGFKKRAFIFVLVVVLCVSLTDAQQSGCTWILYNNTLIYGGTINQANTPAACQSACQATAGCVGIDWAAGNTAGQQCFLQTTQSGKVSNVNGVNHYDLVCNGTSNSPGTSTLVVPFSTTLSPPGCTWNFYNNTLIYGGTINSANTIAACQSACQATAGCVGIDWAYAGNPAGQQCFLQPTQSGKVSNANGVYHYDLVCNGITLSPPVTTSSPGCYWNVSQNTFVPGGTNDPSANLSLCQAACSQEPDCVSIDFSPNSPTGLQCYLHDSRETNANQTTVPGVNHYVQYCPGRGRRVRTRRCRLTFEINANVSSLGGVQVQEIDNVDDCSASCARLETCAGVDFNSYTGCWIHYNTSDFDRVYSQPGVIQTRLNRCPGDELYNCDATVANVNGVLIDVCSSVCYPEWGIVDNAIGAGGQVADVQEGNLTACLEYCFFAADCIGVDYTEDRRMSSSVCSYYSTSEMGSFDNITNVPYSTQYRLINDCARNCSTTYQRVDNTDYHLIDEWIVSASSEGDCLRQCRQSDTCEAAQWTKTYPYQCVLADNYYDFSDTADYTSVTYLFRISCPAPPLSPTPGNSGCTWILYSNTLIYGGTINQANTPADCQSACQATAGCVGIDWAAGNTAGQQCFLQTTQSGKVSNVNGVNHYDLVCNVVGSSTLTNTVGVSTTISSIVSSPSGNCFVPYNNTNIFGGTQNPANTVTDCQNACAQNGTCQGVDFTGSNSAGSRCYLLFTQAGKNPNSPGTVHYDYVCGSGGNSCWQYTPNTLIYQGTLAPSATTLGACYSACLQQQFSACSSIDWDNNYNKCYLHNTQQGKYASAGVDHYDRSTNC